MLCQYLFECLFGAFAHLHSSRCKSAMERGVRQQCAIEVSVAHPAKKYNKVLLAGYFLNAERNPLTRLSPRLTPCQMLKALRAICMAKSNLLVARGSGAMALVMDTDNFCWSCSNSTFFSAFFCCIARRTSCWFSHYQTKSIICLCQQLSS